MKKPKLTAEERMFLALKKLPEPGPRLAAALESMVAWDEFGEHDEDAMLAEVLEQAARRHEI